jgi:DNA gyrase subunit B
VKLLPNDGVSVEDNGRGIPVDMHPEEKISSATVVLTELHAGGKFDKGTYEFSGGLHGVGASVVNALSKNLELVVYRDGKKHIQHFEEGIYVDLLKVVDEATYTGTKITFYPDDKIFQDTKYDFNTLSQRFRELAYLNNGLTIIIEDLRDESKYDKKTFIFENGLFDYINDKNVNKQLLFNDKIFISGKLDGVKLDVVFTYSTDYESGLVSFVNNIKTKLGGTHENGFKLGLSRTISGFIDDKTKNKKSSVKITADDFKVGLSAIVSVKVPEPLFEGQTKHKLTNPEVQKVVYRLTAEYLSKYFEENPLVKDAILSKAESSAKTRDAINRARELSRKIDNSSGLGRIISKMGDCTSKDTTVNELFLTEGDSAGGSAKQGRNRETQAVLPLKGKILNVEKADLSKMLKSEEINNIITAMGCGVGDEFDLNKLKYGKIIILTDADDDGLHIQVLLLTLFYRYFREIIDAGKLYIAVPPLYSLQQNGKKKYFVNSKQLDEYLFKRILEQEDEVELYTLVSEYSRLSKYIAVVFNTGVLHNYLFSIDINDLKVVQDGVVKYINDLNGVYVLERDGGDFVIQTHNGVISIKIDSDFFENEHVKKLRNIYKEIVGQTNKPINVLLSELDEYLKKGKKGLYLQRYKGLGEMNPEQLNETTLDPKSRKIVKIQIQDDFEASRLLSLWMGDDVNERRERIKEYSHEYVLNKYL